MSVAKKIILIVALWLSGCCFVNAAQVEPAVAEAVARQYLTARTGRFEQVSRLNDPRALTKGSSEYPPYYIYGTRRGGFVIVAGDDRLQPVIGWAPEGGGICGGAMPDNMASWLDMWSSIVDDIRAGRLEAGSGASRGWEEIYSGRQMLYNTQSRVLETAAWDQEAPYNLYCPNGSMAGCVAVTAAIVMRYHRWPRAGSGVLPGYEYTDADGNNQSVESITLGHTYGWDDMPLMVDDATPASGREAVAQLLLETGVMVRSVYGLEVTIASVDDLYEGLTTYFGYDTGIIRLARRFYTDDEWCSLLADNIDTAGPLIYTANNGTSGHAFVVDGYSGRNQFHINWGWGGRGNGFFTMPDFARYTQSHTALFNLKPDAGGVAPDDLLISSSGASIGLTSPATEFSRGEPFEASCTYLVNASRLPFKGEVALAVKHRDGTMGEILFSDQVSLAPRRGYRLNFHDCLITGAIMPGDCICLWYRSEVTPEWTFIHADIENGDVAQIPIADAVSLEEATSFIYTAASGILEITTKPDAGWTLKDEWGAPCTRGASFEDGILTIDTNQYKKGSYYLTLTKGDDIKTVEFVFGSIP
ncbi:MAG: C10 family peptidase [Bacteroidales bacterium]|nr:C10 family peptidase [Bacteroidales bacterium]